MTSKPATRSVSMSAPCRLDLGGTLDISTFFYPLRRFSPTTVNLALSMRTTVTVTPFDPGWIQVSSLGFETAAFRCGEAPITHSMGLMFAICEYFGADGLAIDIRSSSPPRSALGGSSVAAVALIAALMKAVGHGEKGPLPLDAIVLLAYSIESSVLRVPCGMQDQLAAAYGGVNAWCFTGDMAAVPYKRRILVPPSDYGKLENRIMAAYCGEPHESVNINGKWVDHFMRGVDRTVWHDIMDCSAGFAEALYSGNYGEAARWMNRETDLRTGMTPDVLDDTGKKLAEAARMRDCGVRFTGAGGGGCVWALGDADNLSRLRADWDGILAESPNAGYLDTVIDGEGLREEPLLEESALTQKALS